jgi:hypothetical protein
MESAYRDAVVTLIEGRFGPLSDDLRAVLKQRNLDQLREVAHHAGTDTLDELRTRLGVE